MLKALGISDEQGRVKPTRQAKYRQVEEFLRLLDASLGEAMGQGHVRTPTGKTRCGSSTSAAATPISPLPPTDTWWTSAGCRSGSPASTSSSSRPTTTRTSRPGSASTPTSSSARSPTRASTGHPTWCWPCTRATRRPTTHWPAPSSGRRRWCLPRRAATTTSPRSCGRRRHRRPTRCSRGTASCASGSPTRSPTPCAPPCCGARATAWTWSSSSRAPTRRATP